MSHTPPNIHASAQVEGTTTPPSFVGAPYGVPESDGVTRSATGVYAVELSKAIDIVNATIHATLTGSEPGQIVVSHTDDTHVAVRTFDEAGVAENRSFYITVERKSVG